MRSGGEVDSVTVGAVIGSFWDWVGNRPWGSFGEWFSGGGAIAAVGVAVLIQKRDHNREDARIREIERTARTREHRDNQHKLTDKLDFHFLVTPATGHHIAFLHLRNTSELRLHNVLVMLCYDITQPSAHLLHTDYLAEVPPGHVEKRQGSMVHGLIQPDEYEAVVAFQDRDGFAYWLSPRGLKRAESMSEALDEIITTFGLQNPGDMWRHYGEWIPD